MFSSRSSCFFCWSLFGAHADANCAACTRVIVDDVPHMLSAQTTGARVGDTKGVGTRGDETAFVMHSVVAFRRCMWESNKTVL